MSSDHFVMKTYVFVCLDEQQVHGKKLMVQGLYLWPLDVVAPLTSTDLQVIDRSGLTYVLEMPQF